MLCCSTKELRKRAAYAYRNGWIDEALEDFLESEKKDPYDFTTHQSLGNVYFFHKKNPNRALEYYAKAVKYSTPKSPYHASLALLHEGLVMYLEEDFEGAHAAAARATELSPDLYEAQYQYAQYCAKLGKYDEAVEHLGKAIAGDRNYCLKPESEADFDAMKGRLQSLFRALRDQAEGTAKEELQKAQELITYAESLGLSTSGESDKFKTAVRICEKVKQFLDRASLFDCWDAIDMALDVRKLALDSLEGYLAGQMVRASQEYKEEDSKLERMFEVCSVVPPGLFCGALVLVYIIDVVREFKMSIVGGILALILGAIIFLILGAIGCLILGAVSGLVCSLIHKPLSKSLRSRYESKLDELRSKSSEVQNKRNQLNWAYEEQVEEP